MNGVDTVSDADIIQALEFEPEVPCDGVNESGVTCPSAARWRISCRGCGRLCSCVCDQHLGWVKEMARLAGVYCGKCGRKGFELGAVAFVSPLELR